MEFIFATKNEGKMREIRLLTAGTGVAVRSMAEAGLDLDVTETGDSFAENAMLKAVAVMEASGLPALADDSGLEIDCLDKGPGVYSARYLGEDTPYAVKNRHILDLLADVPEERRAARFVSAVAAAFPDGRRLTAAGVMEGLIARAPAGENGFGYDPIFYVPGEGMTAAQLPLDRKNAISHRGKALRAMLAQLEAQ